jgi:hypothetical protein
MCSSYVSLPKGKSGIMGFHGGLVELSEDPMTESHNKKLNQYPMESFSCLTHCSRRRCFCIEAYLPESVPVPVVIVIPCGIKPFVDHHSISLYQLYPTNPLKSPLNSMKSN